ncbi:MAG: metallophosphoesterase family protein [Planctomycetota bacterium]|jgi:3',5'-cyclic AMP phosphodiesterase CpdA
MKKIIHMSDLHVGHENLGDRFRLIVRNLVFEKGDKPNDYVIVMTGDLIDDANDLMRNDEVRAGLDTLIQAGFEHILVVPGNHDYGTGMHGDKRFVKTFKQAFFGKDVEYPKKDIIGDIAFIGLDSMAEELNWYDEHCAQGELGENEQLVRLEKILKKEDVRKCKKRVLYMHHHPFDSFPFHELKDSKELGELLRGVIRGGISIDALLYGHNHLGKIHNGRWQISRCYDAGSATRKERPDWISWLPWFEPKSAIRLINLAKKEPLYDYELALL